MFYPFSLKVPRVAEPRLPSAATCSVMLLGCLVASLLQHFLNHLPNKLISLPWAWLLGESSSRPFWFDGGPCTVGGRAVCHFQVKARALPLCLSHCSAALEDLRWPHMGSHRNKNLWLWKPLSILAFMGCGAFLPDTQHQHSPLGYRYITQPISHLRPVWYRRTFGISYL